MEPERSDPLGDVAAFAALGEPRRRRLFDHVVSHERPVGRDEAAEATGIGRSLAAYHLDKLVQVGLLDAVYQRPEGRSGPGAGRPAKHYCRPQRAHTAQMPARDYAFVAQLLAEATDRAGAMASETARDTARDAGRRIGAALASPDELESALAARGFEPYRDADGVLRLRNCAFHTLALAHPRLVCGMNAALIEGMLSGAGVDDHVAVLDPCAGRCCVAVRPRQEQSPRRRRSPRTGRAR